MKAFVEIVELKTNDVITTSTQNCTDEGLEV